MTKKVLPKAVLLICCTIPTLVLAKGEAKLDTDKSKYSYTIGVQFAQQIKQQNIDLDIDATVQALKDILSGKDSKLSDEQMNAAMLSLQELQQKVTAAIAEKNKKEGEAFLAENKKKKGIKTLDNGIQYKIITAGKGKKPKATDTVVVHYRGTLIDGTEFDSSYSRGQPAEFPVNRVIKGWQEVLPLMPTGSKWTVFIPSDLAYGSRGTRGPIGPNATLVFDIELLEIK